MLVHAVQSILLMTASHYKTYFWRYQQSTSKMRAEVLQNIISASWLNQESPGGKQRLASTTQQIAIIHGLYLLMHCGLG